MGLKQNLQDIQTNLANAKTAIAQSITNKGVECSADEALSTYAEKIDNITGGGSGKYVVPNGMKFGYSSSIDMENLDFSNVTDMSKMFSNCDKLTSLDVSKLDASNVTDMSNMFYNCRGLTSLDVSNFDTSKVTNMGSMFSYCSGLTSLDVSNFDTSKVTNMTNMFSDCYSLTSININNWDNTQLISIALMFYNCSGLTSIDLSNWTTTNVLSFQNLFTNCKNLTSIDMSNCNMTNVANVSQTFLCKKLVDLKLNDFGHKSAISLLDLNTCPNLSKESVLFLFEHAFDRQGASYTTSCTIKLHANTKALLSEEEIAIATNKGFTVV